VFHSSIITVTSFTLRVDFNCYLYQTERGYWIVKADGKRKAQFKYGNARGQYNKVTCRIMQVLECSPWFTFRTKMAGRSPTLVWIRNC
jgi:hypothetical protein